MKRLITYIKQAGRFTLTYGVFVIVFALTACSKTVKINIPATSQQVVVDGTIETGAPPIILLSKSQQFFGTTNLNNLGAYFIHGASVKITASDGTQAQLQEFCLQDLNLPAAQTQQLLSALGYTSVDSANVINICAYTVPDIFNYYLNGTCSFMGKERTTYQLSIVAPSLTGSTTDSVHVSATTSITAAVPIDSLVVKPDNDPAHSDSFAAVFVYVTVPDTFGNFIRYETKEANGAFYNPPGGSVYDDKLFVGLQVSLPLERGQAPDAKFDLSTDTYFYRGDTMTLKWSNIDANTYNFFYTLENDGGGSPFSSPVKIKSNVNNGLGVFAGYATRYYSIYVP